ncbi:hypothetical protein [Spartinivicinus poritis]|uniref:Uncharacterized protein n=1 Tax=Spartinivicinus poritis TaxID=2994640 RepID=A0ABT5UI77_9GAMM|nr:hypothetical protein [Spartinivicinus sp. A2-2]MDE1466070.1 hypothetical protein [Spartinivicinus sp. A2-2]
MATSCLSGLADYVKENTKQSCRKMAAVFQSSKSSIHRRLQKIKNRSQSPGASFFESEEGQQWMLRLVVAAIFVFGIMAGVGAERIALFFSLIYISQPRKAARCHGTTLI